MKTWEYTFIESLKSVQWMNENMGAAGWEMCGVDIINGSSAAFWFKREVTCTAKEDK